MQTERATALSHVDDSVHELRHLLDKRGELIDDDHQTRRRIGIPTLLQFHEVLGLTRLKDLHAVVELGGE